MAQAEAAADRPGATPDMPGHLDSRHLLRRLVGLALLVAIVVIAISSLPGLGEVRHRISQADPLLVALIPLLKLGSCLSNIVAFRDVFCRRTGWRFSYQLGMAEQATNVLIPTGGAGGLALGAWALRQGGMPTEHIARRSVTFFVLTSIPNFACIALLGPLLLANAFSDRAPVVPTAVFCGLVWTAAVMLFLLPRFLGRIHTDPHKRSIRARLRRGAVVLGRGLSDTGQLLRDRRWQAILGAFGYLAFDIAAMVTAFAATGGVPKLGPLIFAYTIGQLGGIIPIPGGIGGTDGGLIGATVLYGSPLSQATAAVLLYRVFQLGVPAILGTIAFVQLRITLRRSKAPAIECGSLVEA
ncbi:MAG TPA: flippase-like domain-containing protein [Solirubrobacteraceae bacterium]|nr:flippase-like domain-containing protein [Solirubrobacteraceae bacterium]